MQIILSLITIFIAIIWLVDFTFCYRYYSQTDRNRINFKLMSVISFLNMFTLLIFLLILYDFLHSNILINASSRVVYTAKFVTIFLSIKDLFDKPYKYELNENNINFKAKRYLNIFVECIVYLLFTLSFVFFRLNAVNILISSIACIIAIIKQNKFYIKLFLIYSVSFTLMRIFNNPDANSIIFLAYNLCSSILFLHQSIILYNKEVNKNKLK